jgi:coenzyme F420-reducing hydrogenase delta subunit
MLSQLGISEDQFKAMSPADQQKIAQKIQEMVQQQAQNGSAKGTGLVMDKSV